MTELGDPPPYPCGGQFSGGQFCSHAGLCPVAPCARHPLGNKKYMNMKHLEAALEDVSIDG